MQISIQNSNTEVNTEFQYRISFKQRYNAQITYKQSYSQQKYYLIIKGSLIPFFNVFKLLKTYFILIYTVSMFFVCQLYLMSSTINEIIVENREAFI